MKRILDCTAVHRLVCVAVSLPLIAGCLSGRGDRLRVPQPTLEPAGGGMQDLVWNATEFAPLGSSSRLVLGTSLAAWMDVSNGWIGGGHGGLKQWNGVLVQLGARHRAGTGTKFSCFMSITVDADTFSTSSDDLVDPCGLGDNDPRRVFYWVNVVAPKQGESNAIDATQVTDLFPNGKMGFPCHWPRPGPCNLGSDRRVHPLLEPNSLLTYWHGVSGYTLRAQGRTFEFELLDPVRIDVFRIEQRNTLNPTFDLVKSYGAGIHTILITGKVNLGDEEGMDPPWP